VNWDIPIEFPNLVEESWSEKSPKDPYYNCIAFAASDTRHYWWPTSLFFTKKPYWPAGVPRELSLEAFKAAFATLGFEECNLGDHETGFEKIAIYTLRGKPQHAARQLRNGGWVSKLGPNEDIEHQTVNGVSGDTYGSVAAYMKRPLEQSTDSNQPGGVP
jgi:hypothetical protein